MMSRPFKVFLFMLLFFGAMWAYRLRDRDLRAWLEPGGRFPLDEEILLGLRSPVDQVLDPGVDALLAARFRLEPPPRPGPPAGPRIQEAEPMEPAAPLELAGSGGLPGGHRWADPPPAGPPSGGPADPVEAPLPVADAGEGPDAEREPLIVKLPRTPSPSTPAPRAPSPRAREETRAKDRSRVSHVVRQRETLASLARRYYQNDTDRWHDIFAANQERILDPNHLPLGLVLEIPGAIEEAGEGGGAGGAGEKRKSGRSRERPPAAGSPPEVARGKARGANG